MRGRKVLSGQKETTNAGRDGCDQKERSPGIETLGRYQPVNHNEAGADSNQAQRDVYKNQGSHLTSPCSRVDSDKSIAASTEKMEAGCYFSFSSFSSPASASGT